jgi:cardiolipin synthase A/B
MSVSRVTVRAQLYGALFGTLLLLGPAALGGAPFVNDLEAGFFNNADGSPILALLDSAKKTVDMELYEMDDPQVIASIRDALDRGITVHIVKEPAPVGGSCKVFEGSSQLRARAPLATRASKTGGATCEDQQQLVSDVESAGGSYVPFTKPDLCGGDGSKTCLEHGKIVVVDSKRALIMTGNFNTTNLCDLEYKPSTCNRDYTFLTDDADVVKTLQKVVEKDMKGQSYDPDSLMVGSAKSKLTIGPNSLAPIIAFIKTAKKSIQIQNQYLKDPDWNAALVEMAGKGVSVQVQVSSVCAFGTPSASEQKKTTEIFTEFDDAGIESSMFTKNTKVNGVNGYLHAKTIIVDGKKAWLGSVNGSTQATTLNREFGIFFDDSQEVAKLAAIMESDFSDAGSESWQDSIDCAEKQ